MIAPIAATTPTQQTSGSSQSSSSSSTTASVNKNMFMQLLVAQLKNQDPTNPTDSSQFLTQLAQFQQLEQSTNSGEDISAIRTDLDSIAAAYKSSSTSKS